MEEMGLGCTEKKGRPGQEVLQKTEPNWWEGGWEEDRREGGKREMEAAEEQAGEEEEEEEEQEEQEGGGGAGGRRASIWIVEPFGARADSLACLQFFPASWGLSFYFRGKLPAVTNLFLNKPNPGS